MPDIKDRLSEIEARCAAATSGPWRVGQIVIDGQSYGITGVETEHEDGVQFPHGSYSQTVAQVLHAFRTFGNPTVANMRFIAAARTDIPDLVQLVREQQREIALKETALADALGKNLDTALKALQGKVEATPQGFYSALEERAISEDAHKHPEDLAAKLAAVTRERDEAQNEAKRWSGHNRHSKEVIVRQSRRIEALTRQRDEALKLLVKARLDGMIWAETAADIMAVLSPERTAELVAGQAEGEPK